MTDVVLDAAAVVELLRATPTGERVAARCFEDETRRHIPDSCPIEVTSALRGLVLGGKLSAERAESALVDLIGLPATRYDTEDLLPRTWDLRDNLTTYDALYVALAESLDAVLLTCDGKFDTPAVTRLIDVEVVTQPRQ